MTSIFSRGIGRRKVNILWAIKHPLLLGCLLYIIFLLLDESQGSSTSDKYSNPRKVRNVKIHTINRVPKSGLHGPRALDWFRDNMKTHQTIKDSDEKLLSSLHYKVDEMNENLKKFIRILQPKKNECNGSNILDNSSVQSESTSNNESIPDFVKNSDITEIEIPVNPAGLPGNLHINTEDHSDQTTDKTLTGSINDILGEVPRNLRETIGNSSEQMSETLVAQDSVINETSTTINKPKSDDINESSDVEGNTENYDFATTPRNDESNKSDPTIPYTMAEVPGLGKDDQYNDKNSDQAIYVTEAGNELLEDTSQQKQSETYRINESASTTKYPSELNESLKPEVTSNDISTSASLVQNTSQIGSQDSGYSLKRIILQGVDKIHFSLDENVIKLPQNKADVYLFYYIPKVMNLYRSGDYLHLPNEHNNYEGGYLKHKYTVGRDNDDYSAAFSLHHHKLMHSYAKAKSASKASTDLQTLKQTASSVNHKTETNQTTDDSAYYFVAPYFHNNRTFGNFQFSHPVSSSAQEQANRIAKAVNEERDPEIGNERRKRRTYDYDSIASDLADEVNCSGDVKWCADKSKCIPRKRWCNRIVDCPDKSDELHCTCPERMDALKICDHYVDCPNGEDEMGCFGCTKDDFSCDHSMQKPNGTCIHMKQRCDGIPDCFDRSDELNCELLTDTVDSHETFQTSYASGYLHRNFMGKWYPACIDIPEIHNIHSDHVWGIQACKAELLVDVKHVEVQLLPYHGNYAGKFITHGETGGISFLDNCKYPGYAIHVKCPTMPCGSRVSLRNFLPSRYHSKRQTTADSLEDPLYKALKYFVRKISPESIRKARSSRVVQGVVSKQGEWPWLVALYRDGELHCGGSIIDETWILTAGHCVYQFRSHYYEVYAGMLRRFSFSPSEQMRIVTHVIVHPEYSHKDLKNDLALLKLHEPLKFNRWVRPACLPVDRPPWGPRAGTECTAAGWGSVWEDRPEHPDNLRVVKLPIKSRCKDLADREGEEICAGYEEGGIDTCQGDSGGPLLCRLPRTYDQSYIAGVVSHGEGCARPHEPGAYTRVALFIPWIVTHTDNKFLTPARESSHECPNKRCSYGGRCVGASRICDRIVDCLSAEDEMNCVSMVNSEEDENKLFIHEHYESNKPLDEIRIQNRKTNLTESFSSRQVSNISDQSPIVQNIQPVSPVEELSIEKRETASYFTCQDLRQNIPLEFYCDTEVDCEDGTDEINCMCADYLKVTNESLICDGIIHCNDLSDEKYCQDYNCTSDEFFCFKSRSCIPRELVCDGKKHCFHGEDENKCYWPIPLSTKTSVENLFDIFGMPLFAEKGALAYNDHTVWKWSCFPTESEGNVPETVQKLAKRLGFKNYSSYDHLMVFDDEVLNKRQQNFCPGLLVNFAVAHIDDESLIPWRVDIFVNGIFKCLGVLISGEWVLTDHSCCLKLNTSTDYIVAVFGNDEKLSSRIRTYEEQIILVDQIRCDKQANTALMHLHERTRTTEKTKSLGITSTLKIRELKQNFLLILEDTRSLIFELKVISNCSIASSCYKMKYDMDFCLNSNSSSKFASVISLSKKKEWVFAGIVVESLICLTNETVVSINLPQTLSSKENKFVNITEFYYRGHRGYRCALGNEISWEKVCDGKRDCREKEDEIDSACIEKKLLIQGGFIRPSCRLDEFKCRNGRCVSKSAICNLINDCKDNTDEPETCSNFTCGVYLNLTNPQKLCDSHQDCVDKSDENMESCPSLCDLASSFRCNKSNRCIPLDFVCDGERDCEFGEDEESCLSFRVADNGTEGTIWMRSYGKWKQQCFTPNEMVDFDTQLLCKQFGYTQVTSHRSVPATSHIYTNSIHVKLNNFVGVTLRIGEKLFYSTEYCEHFYLTCR